MAKRTTKKKSTKKKTTKKRSSRGRGAGDISPEQAAGKHLVIVESPTKAKTINKYLGNDYVVMASVGHVRDLPKRAPKGEKQPVPGVDLEHDFEPTYEVMPDKQKVVTQLKKAAKKAEDVWFATDLDREGEAIAWHLAKALEVPIDTAKRVVFNAITKREVETAFATPRSIDEPRVNAQQARRILDRIVGYQVSPFLWKKVAGGLSAGRVQSVAVRLVVEREREIDAFVPDEYWKVTGTFAADASKADELGQAYRDWLAATPEGEVRSKKDTFAWLSERKCLLAELTHMNDQPFKPENRDDALAAARALGYEVTEENTWDEPKAKGMAKFRVEYSGKITGEAPEHRIKSIETKRTRSNPGPPFITSTMQQAAANRLGFQLQRTMRIAQQLYEGVDIHGAEGQTGLITYMRTDSTHLSGEAIGMARGHIGEQYGNEYLPEKARVYTSSNKSAQEAHEAIRPTDVSITPQRVRRDLTDEQFKLYDLIWRRFVASQMTPAQWDATTVLIGAQTEQGEATFKATGRTLVFDGFLKVMGMPRGDDLILPPLDEGQPVGPVHLDPTQHFTSPPPRYTEASLQKKLEEEGIGRPSTYAPIISTIQNRKYVEPVAPRDRRLRATDLGLVVTDMLTEAFPRIMDLAYTREMEQELDQVEDDDLDWVKMLREFYGPFTENLEHAHENMTHAKAVTEPAPHQCPDCGADTVYRFGKNGKFLSCSQYPDCKYAAPIDREGNPQEPELSDILCPECGGQMTKRVGRFGPFLGCVNYPECKGIVNLDPKKGTVKLPKTPPMTTDIPCPKCESPLYMRDSKRGFWLSCSKFPKCRGRVGWTKVEEDKQQALEKKWAEHVKNNPTPVIRNAEGHVIEDDDYVPKIAGESDAPETDDASNETYDSDAA